VDLNRGRVASRSDDRLAGKSGNQRLMHVDRVILDPAHGHGHVAEGQGGQGAAGTLCRRAAA